ncbi:MAG: hypothetical protein U0V56_02930 [Actinomycetota bacterium]
MAIKGKTKGRSRGRPQARAPRREPVVVKPALVQRRWVQLVAAAIVGAFAVVVVVWVTNGLRQQRADEDRSDAAATRRAAAQSWQGTLEGEVGKLGTISPGVPPTVLEPLSGAIDGLSGGKAPDGADETLADALKATRAAAKALDDYDLTSTIADQGFNVEETNYFLNSRSRTVQALRLYEQSALLAQAALAAEGPERIALAKRAAAVRDIARSVLDDGWNDYLQVMFAVGLAQAAQPTGIIPGITGPISTGATGPPGASGPTGAS